MPPWLEAVLSCSVGQSVAVRDGQGTDRPPTLTSWGKREIPVLSTGDAGSGGRALGSMCPRLAAERSHGRWYLRGLRRGEAAGLRWCDVDLDEGTAVIGRQPTGG